MAEPCPLLPISAWDTRGVMHTDADPPQGLVSRIQEALRQLSTTDEQGRPVEVTGQYNEQTAHVLHNWVAHDRSRWPDARLVALAGGAWVTDCTVYRALGLACPDVFVVPGITPNSARLQAELDAGTLDLACVRPAAPRVGVPFWQALLGTLATVVGVPWLSRSR